ncbi:MAG TPA: tetratricopeptide repeat protein [bacterium]|nr:tetratricopeptide repeat protein [bacterium]
MPLPFTSSRTASRRRPRLAQASRLIALLLATLLIGLGVAAPRRAARAQTVEGGRLVLSARAVWDYAEELFREGEYYRAISEYKRLLHFFPDSPQAPAARVRIGQAHLRGGEPGPAIDQFTGLLKAPAMTRLRPDLLYLRGLGRLELEPGAPYSLRERHVGQALDDLRAIPPDWVGSVAVRGFVAAMEHPRDVPSKSPWLAGGLSAVFPGAGSVYVGNYSEGALAFFINALFIGATVQAFHRDNDGLGAVLGVGALAFYGGAIYAAANGAHRFNDHAKQTWLDEQRTHFGIVVGPGGLSAALERSF